MEHSHEQHMPDDHHELHLASKSARRNIIGNLATASIKFAGGILARDPVLASEGGHDIGDVLVHSDHEKEINALTDAEAKKYAIRSAKKLGAFSLIGAGVEIAVESIWKLSAHHTLGLFASTFGLGVSVFLKRDSHKHTHDRAFSLKSHTFWDQLISGTTWINSALLVAGVSINPLIPISVHLGCSFASSWQIYRHGKHHATPEPVPDTDT